MAKPALVAIEQDTESLERIESELTRRYGADYDVICEGSVETSKTILERLNVEGCRVAVVFVDHRVFEATGLDLMIRTEELHPQAKRALLIAWGEWLPTDAVRRALILGQIDFWAIKPWRPPDEEFHAAVGEALRQWARSNQAPFEVVRVVGETWSARSHEIRDLLSRNAVPYGFYEVESEAGRDLLEGAEVTAERLPVLLIFDGRTLIDPDVPELATALGGTTQPEGDAYDLIVIGAGPSGLAASVYGASEGLRTALLEREAIGGQAGTTSMIRNYLGFPRGVSGGELTQRAYEQAWLFGTHLIFGNEAISLRADERRRIVTLADGSQIVANAIILAMGVSYRRLEIPQLEAMTGAGVFYGATATEAESMSGEDVFVVGGGNSAGQAAAHLAQFANRVVLLVRGPSLADSMSEYLVKQLENEANIEIRYQTEVVDGEGESRLVRLTLRDRESGQTDTVPASAVFVLIGGDPRTEWLPDEITRDGWGYVLTGKDLPNDGRLAEESSPDRPPMLLETSLTGVFAVGDVRHASVKRVASAVGEGSIAVRMIHDYLTEDNAGERVRSQADGNARPAR